MTTAKTIWDALKYIEQRVAESGCLKLHTVEVDERGYVAVSIVIDRAKIGGDWYNKARLYEQGWLKSFPEVAERIVIVPYPSRPFVPDYEEAAAARIARVTEDAEQRDRERGEVIGRLKDILVSGPPVGACAGTEE